MNLGKVSRLKYVSGCTLDCCSGQQAFSWFIIIINYCHNLLQSFPVRCLHVGCLTDFVAIQYTVDMWIDMHTRHCCLLVTSAIHFEAMMILHTAYSPVLSTYNIMSLNFMQVRRKSLPDEIAFLVAACSLESCAHKMAPIEMIYV